MMKRFLIVIAMFLLSGWHETTSGPLNDPFFTYCASKCSGYENLGLWMACMDGCYASL